MSKAKKFYAAKGELDKFQQYNNRFKAGYRKRTGSYKYTPRSWTTTEDSLVLDHNIPDRELSEKIKRSGLQFKHGEAD